jgi:hypothetical protein
MRATLALILTIGTIGLGACGGSYDVMPITADDECYSLDCPLMAGGELRTYPVFNSDITEIVHPIRVTVSPPELADVTLDGDVIVIRAAEIPGGTEPSATLPGYGELHVELESGGDFYRTFDVKARATTAVVPDRNRVPLDLFPERKLPGERLAMFDGDALVLIAEHRSIDGQRLLGHDGTVWASDGVQLATLEPAYGDYDQELVRRVRALVPGAATVAFGAASLPLDIVPPKSVARLEVINRYAQSIEAGSNIRASAGGGVTVRLLAYAADGRYIYGGPPFLPITVTSSDPSIVDVGDREIYPDRDIWLTGYGSGTATVTLSFDGLSMDVPVTVD